jgi:uncharacterized protein
VSPAREIARRFRTLLHLDDPPWRIALALAVGVFISCTPFYFFQTLLAILVATLFRLNKAATIAGTWLNLPWLQPFVYALALRIGTAILAQSDAASRQALALLLHRQAGFSWDELVTLAQSLSIALLVGTTLVGVAGGVLTYVIALRLIRARRRRVEGGADRDRRAA